MKVIRFSICIVFTLIASTKGMEWIFGSTAEPDFYECYYILDYPNEVKQECIRVYNSVPCQDEGNYETEEECETARRLGKVPYGITAPSDTSEEKFTSLTDEDLEKLSGDPLGMQAQNKTEGDSKKPCCSLNQGEST